MDELAFNKRYHIAHLLGTDFEKRMYDVYTGMNNNNRPPFLEDIFNDSTQAQALIMLEEMKQNNTSHIYSSEFDSVYDAVWNDDGYTKYEVIQSATSCNYEDIFHDIFRYLEYNRMSVLMGDGTNRKELATLINSPVMQVW